MVMFILETAKGFWEGAKERYLFQIKYSRGQFFLGVILGGVLAFVGSYLIYPRNPDFIMRGILFLEGGHNYFKAVVFCLAALVYGIYGGALLELFIYIECRIKLLLMSVEDSFEKGFLSANFPSMEEFFIPTTLCLIILFLLGGFILMDMLLVTYFMIRVHASLTTLVTSFHKYSKLKKILASKKVVFFYQTTLVAFFLMEAVLSLLRG